jgi:hypothetical protein
MNRLLRESQIPHRQVDHAVPTMRPYTRMQIRVLDHEKLLGAMKLHSARRGACTVAIRETEGSVTRLALDLADRRIAVTPAAGDCDIEMTDVLWASVVSGDLRASQAHRWNLLRATSPAAIDLLDAFAEGPMPWCQEYF